MSSGESWDFKGSAETEVSLFMGTLLSAGILLQAGRSRSKQVCSQASQFQAGFPNFFHY